MPLKALTDLLDQQHVRYDVIPHSPAYTAQEVAASTHMPGREVAKTVIIKIDGRLAMAVLPATDHVHPETLRKALGARDVSLANEDEFDTRFPDCETGAMPPFGNLYGLEVYVSPHLAEDEQICFNAGRHDEVIRMPYRDFERIAHPVPMAL